MVHRDINDVIFTKGMYKPKKPLKNVNPNMGWDTETVNGKCVVLANSLQECWVKGVDYNDISDVFKAITRKEYNNSLNFFYNLTYDTNAFLACLPIRHHEEIADVGITDYKGYRITVIPDKELKISRLKPDVRRKSKLAAYQTTSFYDAAQFFNYQSLESLAIKYTNHHKPVIDDIKTLNLDKIINNEGGYRDNIKNRCVMDCIILKDITDIFTGKMSSIVKVNAPRSKASYSRAYALTHIKGNVGIPPRFMAQCALWAYHGGMIEVLKLGTFKNVHNYDIRSAYPSEIANLYSTNGTTLYNNEYEPETAYSFYEVECEYDHDQISPFWHTHKGVNYHPNGSITAWINKAEIEFLIDKGFDFKILKGRHIRKRSDDDQPFKDAINDLYQQRLEYKALGDDDMQSMIKIVLNAWYGVTLNTITKKKEIKSIHDHETGSLSGAYMDALERGDTSEFDVTPDAWSIDGHHIKEYKTTHVATNMYNPIFGAEITANIRMVILNQFWDKFQKGDVISINTDGVFLTEKSHVHISNELGGMGYKNMSEMVFLGNGRYITLDEFLQVVKSDSANRSLPIRPDVLWETILQNGHKDVIKTTRPHPIKLKESLTRNEYKGKLNQFVDQKKVMYASHKTRHWHDDISCFNNLLDNQFDSRPFNVNEIV